MRKSAELVLGSVQLGMPYGAANRTGQPSAGQALRLIHRAVDAGIASIDTARAYGDSEGRLGEALAARKSVRTVTKLSPLPLLGPGASRNEVRASVESSVAESLEALGRSRIDCLLLHRAAHLTAYEGAVWERLLEFLEDGTLLSLGVSVQSPQEAADAVGFSDVSHIQMPFNLLDWRWREAGIIAQFRSRPDVTVHVRSVYLQGLLASDDATLWPRIESVDPNSLIASIAELVREFGRAGPADLCLAYARGQGWIDGVVLGMETAEQLEENLRFFVLPPLPSQQCAEIERRLPRVPETLLDPSRWPSDRAHA